MDRSEERRWHEGYRKLLTCAATMRTTLCLALVLYPGALGFGVYLMNSASFLVCSPIAVGVAEDTFAPII